MKRRTIENDPLERLFAAARAERVADDGFSQRVAGRIERLPVPPSKSSYRIPTLATAFASVLLLIWTMVSGFDFSALEARWEAFEQRETTGRIRLLPTSWRILTAAETDNDHF